MVSYPLIMSLNKFNIIQQKGLLMKTKLQNLDCPIQTPSVHMPMNAGEVTYLEIVFVF